MKRFFKRLLSFWSAFLLIANMLAPTSAMALTVNIGGQPVDTALYPFGATINFGTEPMTIFDGYYIVLAAQNFYDQNGRIYNVKKIEPGVYSGSQFFGVYDAWTGNFQSNTQYVRGLIDAFIVRSDNSSFSEQNFTNYSKVDYIDGTVPELKRIVNADGKNRYAEIEFRKINLLNAVHPIDVLGAAVEFGVVANSYIQLDHSETNFAVNKYSNPNTKNIDIDGSGDTVIPFYVGHIDSNYLWIGEYNRVPVDVFIDPTQNTLTNKSGQGKIRFSEENKPESGRPINFNKENIHAFNLNEWEYSTPNSMIAAGKEISAKFAKKENVTFTPTALPTDNSVALDLRGFPKDATIVINCNNIKDFIKTAGWTVQKYEGQSIVFNLPGDENILINEFYADVYYNNGLRKIKVKSTTKEMNKDPEMNRNVDTYILEHFTFNAYETKGILSIKNASGIFLAPYANKVNHNDGTGAGWILTGGTYEGNKEWHFYRQDRNYRAYVEKGIKIKKILKKGNKEITNNDTTFTFNLYNSNSNWEKESLKESRSGKAGKEIEFEKFSFETEEFRIPGKTGTTQENFYNSLTKYYIIEEEIPQDAGRIIYDTHQILVKATGTLVWNDRRTTISVTIAASEDGGNTFITFNNDKPNVGTYNNREIEYITISGEKTWEMKGYDSYKPAQITVYIKDGNKTVETIIVKPDAQGKWKYKSKELPKTRDIDNTLIIYKVDEELPTGFTKDVKGYNIKNTLKVGKINVKKNVTGLNTGDETLAVDKVYTFTVKDASGKTVDTLNVTTADTEGKTTGYLPLGTYTIEESENVPEITGYNYVKGTLDPVDGKVTLGTDDETVTVTATNEYTKKVGDDSDGVEIKLHKIDKDSGEALEGFEFDLDGVKGTTDKDGKLTLAISKEKLGKHDGTTAKTFTLSETKKDLYKAAGPWIVTVVPNGTRTEELNNVTTTIYQWKVTGITGLTAGADAVYEIENEKEKGRINVKKVVEGMLTAEAEAIAVEKEFNFSIKNAEGTEVANLTVKSGDTDGQTTDYLPLGTYTIEESENVPEIAGYEYKRGELSASTVVLGTDLETVTVTATNYYRVNSIEVSKIDIANSEELEGAHIQIIDSNGKIFDEWDSTKDTHVVKELLTGETYTLHEEVSPYGYAIAADTTFMIDETGKVTSTGSVSEDGILLIEDAMTSIKVSKVDIVDGKELPGAEIQIIDSEGNVVEKWTSSEEAYEITGLKTGEEYTLREIVAPEGYTIATDTTFTIDETGKVTSTGSVTEDGILLVEDAMTSIKVSKVDIANGEELPGAHIQIIDSEGNVVEQWDSTTEPYEITGLKTGEEYILRETVAPHGYDIATDTTFTIDELGNVTSTGSVTENGILLVEDGVLPVTAAVKKIWNDENNQDGVRPLTVRVNLLANGVKVDSAVLSMANGWMAVINDLPMVDKELKDIEYTWEEEAPGNGYTLTSQEKKGTLTTITNSRTPEKTGFAVQKIWDDDGNKYQTRPNEIRVQLFANGKACGEAVTLNAANSWKAEWTGLAKFTNEDGQSGHATEVIYTVEELEVPEGYQATVTGNAKTGFVIKNVLERGGLIIEKNFQFGETEPDEPDNTPMDIPVTKTWNDNGNKDGNRPASITVRLLADGTEVARAELTAADGWGTVFTGLPRYNGEEKIHYTITEDPVAWYTAEINGFNIRNNYVPEVTSATVRKVWDDNNNAEKMRPSSIHVTLSNGTTVLLSEENGWTATINNLPTRVNGKPVTYTWTEQTVIAYKQSKVEQQGSTTVFTNSFTRIPKVPELPKKPTVPDGTWERFEEYDTPLGVQTIINHVGDCFD